MNPNLGSSRLRNSQGNLFLKTDIVSKLLHLMNPIRRENLLQERLFVEDDEQCKKGWTLIFKKDSSFTLYEIRQLMMKFLQPKDLELVISTLRKMVGEKKGTPEEVVEIRRGQLLQAVRQLRREEFTKPEHVRFLFELLCERVEQDPAKGLDLRAIKKIIREEKLPYDDERLIDVLVEKITEKKGEELKIGHLERYLEKHKEDHLFKSGRIPGAVPEVIQAVGEKQIEERKEAAKDKKPKDQDMMRSLFPSAPKDEVKVPQRAAPAQAAQPARRAAAQLA